ncbi:MAG: efflux RND transporter permease subunit [Pseudomonadota bacterium]
MSILDSIHNRPVGFSVVFACITLLGLFSLTRMPLNLTAETRFPAMTITTRLADADPEEIETLVTKQVEEALADVPGLKEILSTSSQGQSETTLLFHLGTDVSESASQVRSRLRRLRPSLPEDVRPPITAFYNPSDAPLVVFGVTGDCSLAELSLWVERSLKLELSRISGVAAVRTSGEVEREIKVDCEKGRLRAHDLTVHDVSAAIATGHIAMASGFMTEGDHRIPIRTLGGLDTPEDIAEQPVSVNKSGAVIRVGDIAEVRVTDEAPERITRYNGRRMITAAVYRTSEADLRSLWKNVKEAADRVQSLSKVGVNLEIIFSQAEHLDKAVDRLKGIMGLAALSTALVILVFLRSPFPTLVVVTAIPFSGLFAILLMNLCGIRLDILSLTGLALAVGMLVDNAIVVMEAISYHRAGGAPMVRSIVLGTREVAVPLTFSTAATVAVFIPLVFVSPKIRIFFSGVTWTVSLSLLASLIAALGVVPLLFRRLGGRVPATRKVPSSPAGLSRIYGAVLAITMRHPVKTVVPALIIVASPALLLDQLSFRQGMPSEQKGFRLVMVTQPGMAAEATDKQVKPAEEEVVRTPGVIGVQTEVWENQGRLTILLKETPDPDLTVSSVMEKVEKRLRDKLTTQFHLMPFGEGADNRTLTVNVTGPMLDQLSACQSLLKRKLSELPEVQDVVGLQGNPRPEVEFILVHERIGYSGVSGKRLADHLRADLTGPVAARIFSGERQIKVRVRGARELSQGLEPLMNIFIPAGNQMIPLLELARPAASTKTSQIHRENRKRVAAMKVILKGDDVLKAAGAIRTALDQVRIEPGYAWYFGDEAEQVTATRAEMMKAAGLGLLLVYLMMTAATESFLAPLVIMTAAPGALAGVVVTMVMVNQPIGIPVYMGVIILGGLVVNINIVLIHAIRDRSDSGEPPEEAIKGGAQRRLRAILMTTLTTLFGCLPMLIDRGTGSEAWAPFALTLTAGLAAAAVFSLLITPPLYLLVGRLELGAKRLGNGRV